MTRDQVNAAYGVDQFDQTQQTDPDVVIYLDSEILRNGRHRGSWTAVRVRAVDLAKAAR